jgi:hypothetical protein
LEANEAINGKKYFGLIDLMKIYARKYFRLAPFYYFILFLGWSSCTFVSDGPIWSLMNNLWYDCGSKFWAKIFMVGNLVGY